MQAALEGDEALRKALDRRAPVAAARAGETDASLPAVWLHRLEVRGFRGVGPEVLVDLTPGPGLVLVVGRNGSGKSSLAEALEVLLTGDSRRFAGRSSEWRAGWRNLAEGASARIAGHFTVEKGRSVRIERTWPDGVDLAGGVVRVFRGADPMDDGLAALGWNEAVASWRPMLGTTELQRMFDGGPSQLFDALRGILGLEEIVAAERSLAEARKETKRVLDAVKHQRQELRNALANATDARAKEVAGILSAKKVDHERLGQLAQGVGVSPHTAALRELTQCVAPDGDTARAAADAVRDAVARAESEAASVADVDLRSADVLEHALAWHLAHGDGSCPVCGEGTLSAEWRARAEELLRDRKQALRNANAARAALRDAETAARGLLRPLRVPSTTEIDTTTLAAAIRGMESGAALAGNALAAHVASAVAAVADAVRAVVAEASAELARREDLWDPFRKALRTWLDAAAAAEPVDERFRHLERAEKWLKDTEATLRGEAFEPLAARARAIWGMLRQSSSVELSDIRLAGTTTNRHVEIDVAIDGQPSVALSVMSQGEINSLALALFLPRATQDASPFRFVIVDDPVQSMDPSKVDGLARLLAEEASRRQVIVFTHDPRLADAVRRLRLPAKIVGVSRRGGSVVELRTLEGPAEQQLDDARAAAEADGLGALATRVVPGLCRAAVEARLLDAVRRVRLGGGASHDEVDEQLRDVPFMTLFAMALFDDPRRGGDVFPKLHAWHPHLADTVRALKEGVHQGVANPRGLVSDTWDLVRRLDKELR